VSSKGGKAGRTSPDRTSPGGKAAGRKAAGPILGGHGPDLAGVALVTAGLVCGLAVYGGRAGPAGRALADGAGSVFGLGRYGLPVALVAAGGLILYRRALNDSITEFRATNEYGRLAAGLGLVVVAGCGLLHVWTGGPGFGAPGADLRDAGGMVGLAAGESLRSVLAGWGAATVLLAVLAVGCLVVGRTTVRAVGHHAVTLARAGRRGVGRAGRSLATLVPAPRPPGEGDRLDHPRLASPPATVPTLAVPPVPDAAPPSIATNLREPDAAPDADAEPVAPSAAEGVATAGHAEQLEIDLGPAAERSAWRLPPLSLLKLGKAQEVDRRLVEAEGRTLEAALAAHGVETSLVGMTVGPTVTRYELALGPGVKVARVTNLHRDIAYAMASADVRILAPIPGRSAIGVEVPNKARQLVLVGDILTSVEAAKATHPLEVALGRDIAGRPVLANLAEMPHVLIAGATGAGKSSCINSLITSILVRSTPDQVRMILVDPKRVELGQYNGLPHLLTQVVVNPKKAANALAWAVHEMERRYDLLAEVGVRDVTGYNAAYDRGDLKPDPKEVGPKEVGPKEVGHGSEQTYPRLPFIVIVVDELNDLMMVAARDVEESICRIAQMARAVGIHLVIATQRPSVDVITGVIKANIPSRLAFAVSSLADSRVILDQPGAERLIGQGDMLLAIASSNVPRRVQGAWVGEDEVRKIVAHWRRQASPQYVDGVEGEEGSVGGGTAGVEDDDEEHLDAAMELVVRSQLGSTSMLQRKLRVGFARAGRLMDLLERRGVVGPSEGSKARAVLMTPEELDELRARQ
jgi:S-DNA-T family DNA segregation ATPase FtsK/SpoIIIE